VLRDEVNPTRYAAGTMGMALSGPDTGGSQFFITHGPQPHLDGTYPLFGRVVEGQAVASAATQGDRIRAISR
jgi:cyclophilin family peptidyl-prolyl cis-trans isomerase